MRDETDKVLTPELTELLLDALDPIEPGAEPRNRMRNKLFERIASEGSDDALLTVNADSDNWIQAAPGNQVKILREDAETMSMLVRLEPGATFPAHSHPADEETFVIEGDTCFGDIPLTAGDYHLAPAGSVHGEVTTENGCLLLIRKSSTS